MIVCIALVSGLLDKLRQQNGRRERKSREEVVALFPACSDVQHSICFEMTSGEIS